ncbi:MAG: hypothetical protein IKW65_02810 [Bacteroidales bacterium]|nr:hypothetical protein [Bacteroidales bacterium]
MITERDEINIRRTAEQKARAEGRAEGKAEGVAEGMAKGKAEGRAEGRKEGLFEVAKSLLGSGMSVCDVSRHTGLSESEIEELLR